MNIPSSTPINLSKSLEKGKQLSFENHIFTHHLNKERVRDNEKKFFAVRIKIKVCRFLNKTLV